MTTVAFWSASACRMVTNSWTVICAHRGFGGHMSKASTVSATGTKPSHVLTSAEPWDEQFLVDVGF